MPFYTRLLKRSGIIIMLLALGACSSLNGMVADFEDRWTDPSAALDQPIGPTPEELAKEAEAEADVLLYATEVVSAEDCSAITEIAPRVLAINSSHIEIRLAMAECALEARDLASAKSVFTDVFKRSADPRAERGLGLVAILDGKYGTGRGYLSSAAKKLPDDWRSWNGLGFAEDSLQNWAAAEQAYRRAASLSEANGSALNNLAMSYIRQKKYVDAINILNAALSKNKGSAVAKLNLRLAHALNGQIGTALAGASEKERAVIYNTVGVSALSDGRREYARSMFNRALATHPGFYVRAHENLERTRFMSLEKEG